MTKFNLKKQKKKGKNFYRVWSEKFPSQNLKIKMITNITMTKFKQEHFRYPSGIDPKIFKSRSLQKECLKL